MVTLRQAAQQALEALKAFQYRSEGCVQPDFVDDAITTLRQALAEQQPEPCKACGEGQADLAVLRICDKCGSEYAGQAEFDLAMRLQAEQQDEPFGYFRAEPFGWTDCAETDEAAVALYDRPQQPAQQPLTEEQIDAAVAPLYQNSAAQRMGRADDIATARAIEHAHGITGETK
jgi:hypothetical protein